jgi:altronate dehydratase large subunit
MSFLGYPRSDGTVGTRNYVVILPAGLVSSKICEFVNGVRTMVTADSGNGRSKRDRETIARILVGLGKNPNVAAVILHELAWGTDYPELKTELLAAQIAKTGKPVEYISSAKYPTAFQVMERGARVARQMVHDASSIRREPVDDKYLTIGVKCGGSDATSGIAGNPVMGYLFDHVVKSGGMAMFGENTEIIGAEHILARRAADEKIAKQIINVALATEERGKRIGEPIRAVNPVPANIAAGISTLEEKSLGAIVKGGTCPIKGVLRYGERPPHRGLFFVDNWQDPNSIFPGYVAAGANVVLLQLGFGGALKHTILPPTPTVVVPDIATTANRKTYAACGESIDFFSGTVIAGEESISQAGERLCEVVRQVASGTMSRSETLKFQDVSQCFLMDAGF